MLQPLRRFGRTPAPRDTWCRTRYSRGPPVHGRLGVLLDRAARERDAIRLESAVVRIQNSLTTRIETYTALLRAAAGLFAASEQVKLHEFRGFVEQPRPPREIPRHPGHRLRGTHTGRAAARTVAALRAEGVKLTRVWPDDPAGLLSPDRLPGAAGPAEPCGGRVRHVYRVDPPHRDGARSQGRRGGDVRPRDAGPGDRPREAGRFPHLLAGVFLGGRARDRGGAAASTSAASSTARSGPATSSKRCSTSVGEAEVSLRVYDGPAPVPERLLHDSHDGPARGLGFSGLACCRTRVPFQVPGRTWTFVVTTLPVFHLGIRVAAAAVGPGRRRAWSACCSSSRRGPR